MKIITNEAFIEGQGSTSIADANTPKVAMAVQSPAVNVQLARSHP